MIAGHPIRSVPWRLWGRCATNLALAVALLSATAAAATADSARFAKEIRPLLDQYCVKCHGGKKPKAGITLDQLKTDTDVYRDPRLWQGVAAQLHERAMPPEDKPQPSQEERDRLADSIKQALDSLENGMFPKDPGRVLIHRLSRLEYNNTIRDLLGVDTNPADKFPADGGGGAGFDNIAETLFVPPILMERFLAAADEILAAAKPERIFVAKPSFLTSERSAALKIISHFAPKAFRRPSDKTELKDLAALYDHGRRQGLDYESSVKLALKAVLVSPNFLFRVESERASTEPYRISDFELASRLSYFLWSSMPDEELFNLAAKDRLHDPEILRAQTRRMLLDPKGRTLADNFAGQWLRVRELGTTAQPDTRRFPKFTTELRDAMVQEPLALFHSILREDASLLDLIDCDYTYVNETLAAHYDIPGVAGTALQRVSLTNHNRGGVLGMGAVLALTSYPLRTSPVLRGKWVLEEILGTPPPPPPPEVKTLPRDDSPKGGLTFRQQLEKHRADPSCASCHKRMDPLGLGLENFDAIGAWRAEVKGVAVDSSGVLVTGEAFQGPIELKKLLMERRDLFVRNLTEKMLSYALGRGLDYFDAPVVKEIARTVAANNYRSSVLVTEIVRSYPFQYRRAEPAAIPVGASSGGRN